MAHAIDRGVTLAISPASQRLMGVSSSTIQLLGGQAGLNLDRGDALAVDDFLGDTAGDVAQPAMSGVRMLRAYGASITAERVAAGGAGRAAAVAGPAPAAGRTAYTGARTLPNPNALTQAEAEQIYGWVRGLDAETNIATVARNTGVPEQVVRSVRQHVFFEEHLLPTGADGTGRLVMRRFDADQGIAAWWKAATEGGIPKAELERVQAIFAHEYVERALMRSGMPYLHYHPPFQYPGAHPLSPLFPNTRPGTPVYPPGVGPWDHLQRYGP
jgi:hypothetical protein